MKNPLQITFHGIDHSDAVEQRVREKTAKLEQLTDRIISCRVVIERPSKNQNAEHVKHEPYHVRLDVTVPGAELVVKRDSKNPTSPDDVYVVLRDAYDAMTGQLKAYLERQRGDVKTHAAREA